MLLEEALSRARAVTSDAYHCAVVAEQQRRWWENVLWLLPLLHIAERDPKARFVEKPSALQARELIEHGGLWNAFILASTVPALLNLFNRRMGGIVRDMRTAVRQDLCAPIDRKSVV